VASLEFAIVLQVLPGHKDVGHRHLLPLPSVLAFAGRTLRVTGNGVQAFFDLVERALAFVSADRHCTRLADRILQADFVDALRSDQQLHAHAADR
jgi:hypothetical protein